jgi:hypothetical protein
VLSQGTQLMQWFLVEGNMHESLHCNWGSLGQLVYVCPAAGAGFVEACCAVGIELYSPLEPPSHSVFASLLLGLLPSPHSPPQTHNSTLNTLLC